MKEAAGEANMTIITIVLIALVLTAGTVVVNRLMASTKKSSACLACGGEWSNGSCSVSYTECMSTDEGGGAAATGGQ
jgi:uncharacterized membrane protein